MSSGEVVLERRDTIGWITLERPDKLNALAGDMREQLRDAIAAAARDAAIHALVITGSGRAFCAGGDVAAMSRLKSDGRPEAFHGILHAGAECVLTLQAFPGLTVAAVNGVAAGAGFALALGCDLRVLADEARFAASWGGLGLVPDWGATHWLPQMLGYGRAADLIFTGRVLTAPEALAAGLATAVVPAADLHAEAQRLATEKGAARDMVRQVKYLLRRGLEGSLEASLAAETEAQEDLFEGDDVAEGLTAFQERRPPRFGER